MLGSAINVMMDGLAEARRERAKEAEKLEEWKARYARYLNNGNLPPEYQESKEDYFYRLANYYTLADIKTVHNKNFQIKTIMIALYSVFYDKGIRNELKAVEDKLGYVPKNIIEHLIHLARKQELDKVNPHKITIDDLGKPDLGSAYYLMGDEDFIINPVSFCDELKGSSRDYSGHDINSTKYYCNDSKELLKKTDETLNKIEAFSAKLDKIKDSGRKVQLEDFNEEVLPPPSQRR